jgi:hypothetical protein
VRPCMAIIPAIQNTKVWNLFGLEVEPSVGNREFPPNTPASKHTPIPQTLAVSIQSPCVLRSQIQWLFPHLDHLSVLQFPRFYISLLSFGV